MLEAVYTFEEGTLAGTARPNDADHLAFGHTKAYAAQDLQRVEALVDILD